MTVPAEQRVVVGRISGQFGVRGWLRIFSDTEPRENILTYNPWLIERGGEWQAFRVLEGHLQGKGVVARLAGVEDRDAAASLMGAPIAIRRDQLPPTAADEYYWADLIGLAVMTDNGVSLGRVAAMMDTGAHAVLVVEGDRERLIPFIGGQVIRAVDLDRRIITVNWDPDF